ncbi:MAG: tyrosine--tRNA ligase [Cytophagales bacterium]|nr:MAG: tyrosine--tRNA ligase [Cytophagales bacterium]
MSQKTNFIAELQWRGMLQDITPNTENYLLAHQKVKAYIGFDPTASSLHIGNLATLMLLKHFQLAGHSPIVLVGGATGMIGDPSGKSKERVFLDETTLQHNIDSQKKQLAQFLDFEGVENPAEIVNNYDWFKNIGFIEFLREAGKFINISYMMGKDSVQKRLETGISFTEFSYQLLQGFDFYWLHQNKECMLQMGGSDQWGNITTGIELIKKKIGKEVFALTCPLLTKADGTKYGKSEGGNIWLDPQMTSPYKFYQYWIKDIEDADIIKFLRVLTLLDRETIENLTTEYAQNPNGLRRILAENITTRVHGKEACQKAIAASNLLYGKSTLHDFENTDAATLEEVFAGVPQKRLSKQAVAESANWVDLMAEVMQISKSDIRRLLKGNGISINQQKISENDALQTPQPKWIKDQYILLQKGKQYYLIVAA